MNLLSRLVLLVLLAVTPATAILAWSQGELRHDREVEVQSDALREAHDAAGRLDAIVDNLHQLLIALAEAPALRDDDPAACTGYLTRLRAQYPGYLLFGVMSPGGSILCNSMGAAPHVYSSSGSAYQSLVAQTGQFSVGEYALGAATGRRTLHVAQPILDGQGRIMSAVFAGLSLDWLASQIGGHLPADTRVSVIDRKGVVLLRGPADAGGWVGRPVPAPLLARITRPGEEVWGGTGIASTRTQRILARAPLTGAAHGALFVYVSVDRASALAPVDAIARRDALLLGAGLVLAVLAAVLGGRAFIRRPVAQMLDAMERRQAGDTAARVSLGDRRSELGRLGMALDGLLDALGQQEAELREANDFLEQHVVKRTEALEAANRTLASEINERRQAEEALRRREAEFEAFYNDAPVPLYQLDADARMVLVSRRWLAFMGYTDRAEVLGRHVTEFQTEASARKLVQQIRPRLLQTGAADDIDYQVVKRSGEIADVLGSARIIYDDQGKPLRTMSAIVDVTARRRAEEQLRQSQKMEAVGQLTSGLAHDFNNLLTGITGSLELLSTRIAQGRFSGLERYTAAAQGAAQRAAALTHRLLAFSRRQTLDPKPTDASRLVAGMEELIRRTVGPAIAVETVRAEGLWPTLVDPPQLENVLLNLCINARDAMPDGGRLTIETANESLDERAARERELPPGHYVSLRVTDTGTGMTPDVIARAFDPFFTTKPTGQGTGLGLSMVYGFARQSGGQVRIYSELGQGTTVALYLPRHCGPGDGAETALEPAGAPAPHAGQGETVLVVDDEPTVRMLAVEVLEELRYAMVEAADAASALTVLRSDRRIDLLVTDVGLPGGMNGRQLADAARELRPELEVLFITGYAETAVVGNGQLERGMHVLTKPFTMEGLASRVRELIAGKRPGLEGR